MLNGVGWFEEHAVLSAVSTGFPLARRHNWSKDLESTYVA